MSDTVPGRAAPAVPLMFAVVVLVQFVSTVGLTTIYAMIASLRTEYAGGSIDISWAISVYLFIGASAGVCGRLGDVHNRKHVVLGMLAIATVGALVSILIPTPIGVLTGCALQGMAGALTPMAVGLAKDNLPARHVPLALGAISAAGTAGGGLVFYCSGWITDHYASHGAFVMKLVFALLALVAVTLYIPSRPAPSELAAAGKQIRFGRGLLFMPPLAALLVAINRVLAWGLFDPRTIGLFAIALIGLALWARDQGRQKAPLVDVRLLSNRRFALAIIAHFILGIGAAQYGQTYAFLLLEPAWTGFGIGLTAAAAGMTLGLLNGSTAFSAIFAGKLVAMRGARWTAIAGSVLTIAGWAILFVRHAALADAIVAAAFIVTGMAMLFTSHYGLFVEESPEGRSGEVSALGYIALTVAMALGSQIVLVILDSSTVADPVVQGLRHADSAALARVLIYIIACSVAMMTAQILLARRPKTTSSASQA